MAEFKLGFANGSLFNANEPEEIGPFSDTGKFFEPDVPGAAQGNPEAILDNDPEIAAAIAPVVGENVAAAQTEQTDQEKAQEEQEQKNRVVEKTQLEAKHAAEEAGIEQLPEPEVQGAALVDQGFNRQQDSAAAAGGVASGLLDVETDATIDAAGQIVNDTIALEETRANTEAKTRLRFTEINDEIRTLVQTDVKKPTPSVLNLIGVALGGLIAPMQGGRNPAAELLQAKLQREVQVDIENRRTQLSGLKTDRGLLLDEAAFDKDMLAQKSLLMAKKLEGAKMQITAELSKPFLSARAKNDAKKMIGVLEVQQGEHQMKAAKIAMEAEQRRQILNMKAAQAQAKRSRGGGGRGRSKGRGLVSEAKESPLFFDVLTGNTTDVSQLSKKDQARIRKEAAVLPMTDNRTGQTLRGIRGLDSTQAKGMRKVYGDRNQVRLGAQRILKTLNLAKGADRLSIGGAFLDKEGARLEGEFTHLMIALKNQWELGAITGPDMELMEGAMGMKPGKAWAFLSDKMNINQIQGVIENLQSRGALKMKTSILSEAGLPDHISIDMPQFKATTDIKERSTPQAALTGAETAGDITALIEERNLAATGVAEGGTEAPSISEISEKINKLVARFRGSAKESQKGAAAGGEGAGFHEREQLRGLLPDADPETRKVILKGLRDMDKITPSRFLKQARKLAFGDMLSDPETQRRIRISKNPGRAKALAEAHFLKSKKGKKTIDDIAEQLRIEETDPTRGRGPLR